MKLTDEQKEKILSTLRECQGNTAKVAHRLRIPETLIQEVDMKVNGRWNYTPEGRGPVEKQKYIVAIRDLRTQPIWDANAEAIIKARKDYDDGRVELVTGRDGFNFILYAIPRKERVKRKPYFVMIEEEPNTADNVVHL